MPQVTAVLTLTDPKKHSVRYDDKSDDAPVSSLYVSKSSLRQLAPTGDWPQTLTLAITTP
jgi:hypothetical protein